MHSYICIPIENGHKSSPDLLHDFCDGEVFATHPLFSVKAGALQIFFYFDELELANPLGSKVKIHKLGTIKMYTYRSLEKIGGWKYT